MSDDLILPFERRLNTQTEAEILGLYLAGKIDVVKLSPKLQEKLNRLEVCRDLYYMLHSQSKVVAEMLRIKWHKTSGEEYTISQPTAYRDFAEMVELFNANTTMSGLNFHVEILLSQIAETRKKAQASKDWKTMAACEKNYAQVLEKFFGNQDAEQYRKLQPPVIVTDFLPEQSKVVLPPDWEEQIKREVARKRKQSFFITDAEIIDETPHERNEGEDEAGAD